MKQAIVIGSGIGGMSVAIRLAAAGHRVDVFEKNNDYGGKMGFLEDKGYRFDLGPSLLTQIGELEGLFHSAGRELTDYLEVQRLPIVTKYFFPGGKIVNAHADRNEFVREIQESLQEDGSRVQRYLDKAARHYDRLGNAFLDSPIHMRRQWMTPSVRKALPGVNYGLLFTTLDGYHRKSFSQPETVQLFNRFATYNGSDPYRAPGMISIIPHLEHNEGAFYAKGGMRAVGDAVYKLATELGVRFHFNRPVQHIIHHEGRVRGIVADDKNIFADIVISNIDVYHTYANLLNDAGRAARINRKERSTSAFVFYWGIQKEFPQFELHNIIFGGDYRQEFHKLFKLRTLHEDPTVYLYISSKSGDRHAPPGKENWYVMVNAPANYGQDWERIRPALRDLLLRKLSQVAGEDIQPLIDVEHFMDPVEWEARTGAWRGSIYGSSSNSKGKAFLRHANFDSTIRGLYFVGGTVHPGGGIPLSLRSAKIVHGLVDRERGKKAH